MSKLESIADGWDSFRQAVYSGPGVSGIQLKETQRAFYAGVIFLYSQCSRLASDDFSEEDVGRYMNGVEAELKEHQRKVYEEIQQFLKAMNDAAESN